MQLKYGLSIGSPGLIFDPEVQWSDLATSPFGVAEQSKRSKRKNRNKRP